MSTYENRPGHDMSQGSGRHITTPTEFGGGHFPRRWRQRWSSKRWFIRQWTNWCGC